MRILAIIPARGGSKGIKRKNLQNIKMYNLLEHAIITAQKSKFINRIIVSSDDEEIIENALEMGAECPFIRPKEFALDNSMDYEVFFHCIDWLKVNENYVPDIIVQLRPTVPLRDVYYIDNAIECFIENIQYFDSLRSISHSSFSPYKMWELLPSNEIKLLLNQQFDNNKFQADMPRQSLPVTYQQDGFVDILTPKNLYMHKNMSGNHIYGYKNHKHSYDIDTHEQLDFLKKIIISNYKSLMDRTKYSLLEFGTIQGRLSVDSENRLQFFPHNWIEEFDVAHQLKLKSIEWIIERESSHVNNPLLNDSGVLDILKTIQRTSVKVDSVCFDLMISHNILELENIIKKLIHNMSIIGAKYLILPFMEQSDLNNFKKDELLNFLSNIIKYSSSYKVSLLIESNCAPIILEEILKSFTNKNVGICFDFGNRVNLSENQVLDLKLLLPYVKSVHLKDKDIHNKNVHLTEGSVDLFGLLKVLYENNYTGNLIFESVRGENCKKTMKKNISIISKILEEIECQTNQKTSLLTK